MSLQAPNPDCMVCKGDGIFYRKQPSHFFPGTIARRATICDCMRRAVKAAATETLGVVAGRGRKVLRELKAMAKGGAA
jgi:hypothetical protein